MNSPVTLHPALSPPEVRDYPGIEGGMINAAGVIMIAKRGETPQARELYRLWLAEFRALEGQPLALAERESSALLSAFARMGISFTEA